MRAILVVVAALAVAAAAPAAPAQRIVPGTPLRISLPSGWEVVDHATALKLIHAVGTLNPQLASFVSLLVQKGSLLKLVAVDVHSRGGFATNANVVAERAPLSALDGNVALELATVRQVAHPIGLKQSTTTVAGTKAISVTYEARFNEPSGPTLVAQHQLYFQSGSTLYVLTLTTLPSQRAHYARAFAGILSSLTFTQ